MIEKMIEFLYTLRYDDNRDQQGHDERHNYNRDPRFGKNYPRRDDGFYDGFFPPVVKLLKSHAAKPALSIVRKPSQEPEPEQTSKQTPGISLDTIHGPLLTNTHLFVLGEYYDIPSLRHYAKCQYEETVERRWDNEFFIKSVDLIYQKCVDPKDHSLKEVMIQTARNNIKVLLTRERFVKLLRMHEKFSFDVLRDCVDVDPKAKECNCNNSLKNVSLKTTCSYCHETLNTYIPIA